MRPDADLAALLAGRGWGVFPVAVGGKVPTQQAPPEDPDNRSGRLDWTPERLARWRDPRWQKPDEMGGVHQAVWCPEHAAEVWGRAPMLRLVGIVHYGVACLDVDDAGWMAADPVLADLDSRLRAAGAVEAETPGGGVHLYIRWPSDPLARPGPIQSRVSNRSGADLKHGGAAYSIAPGQRTDADDAYAGYWMADESRTLPAVADLPVMDDRLAAKLAAVRNWSPAPPARQAVVRERGPVSLDPARFMRGGGGMAGWVARAVEEKGAADWRVRAKPPFGCHGTMLRWCAWAGGNLSGESLEASKAALHAVWRKWGGEDREFDRMWRRR